MKTYEKTLYIKQTEADHAEKLLNTEPSSAEECFGEDETFEYSVSFDDNVTADIMICGVQYREGESNTAWSQAVLYNEDGREIAVSEPSDYILGEWTFEIDNAKYIITVKVKRDIENETPIESEIKNMFEDNEYNKNDAQTEGGYNKGYYEGYHDALLDVMDKLGFKHNETFYN